MTQKPANKGPVKKNNYRVNNKVEIDANSPIPFDGSRNVFHIDSSSPYLPFLNPRDSFASDLAELRGISVTHGACINTKSRYCAGVGIVDSAGKEIKKDKAINEWFSSMNLRGQGITKIIRQIFSEYFTFGNCPIELVKFTSLGKKKLYIYPHSILNWRLSSPNAETDICETAIFSKLFRRDNQQMLNLKDLTNHRIVPVYNKERSEKENWVKDKNGAYRTILWYKNDFTGFDHYGLPEWIAAFIYALLEYKGARYNLDNLENNLVAAAILVLKGTMSPKEADAVAKKIIRQHTGDGKRGRTVVVSTEDGETTGSDLHKLDTKTDGSYRDADQLWSTKIILAHEWDSILAGLVSPSTLGKGSGFLTKIIEHKLNTVIRPAQNELMADVFQHIFKIAQDWMGLDFAQYKLAIENSIDISGLTDVDITPAVTRNEVRRAKNLPEDPSEKGNEYLKSAAGSSTGDQTDKGGTNV